MQYNNTVLKKNNVLFPMRIFLRTCSQACISMVTVGTK